MGVEADSGISAGDSRLENPETRTRISIFYSVQTHLLSIVLTALTRNKRHLIKNTFILDILVADIVDCVLRPPKWANELAFIMVHRAV